MLLEDSLVNPHVEMSMFSSHAILIKIQFLSDLCKISSLKQSLKSINLCNMIQLLLVQNQAYRFIMKLNMSYNIQWLSSIFLINLCHLTPIVPTQLKEQHKHSNDTSKLHWKLLTPSFLLLNGTDFGTSALDTKSSSWFSSQPITICMHIFAWPVWFQ